MILLIAIGILFAIVIGAGITFFIFFSIDKALEDVDFTPEDMRMVLDCIYILTDSEAMKPCGIETAERYPCDENDIYSCIGCDLFIDLLEEGKK